MTGRWFMALIYPHMHTYATDNTPPELEFYGLSSLAIRNSSYERGDKVELYCNGKRMASQILN